MSEGKNKINSHSHINKQRNDPEFDHAHFYYKTRAINFVRIINLHTGKGDDRKLCKMVCFQ